MRSELLETSGFGPEPFGRFRPLLIPSAPTVDLTESDTGYRLAADLAGLDENDIEVKWSGAVLTTHCEKSEEREEEAKDHHLSERQYGSFRFPAGVDQEKISAEFKKGVLSLTLPKTKEAQKKARRIKIK